MLSTPRGVPRSPGRVTRAGTIAGLVLTLALAAHAGPAFGPKEYVVTPGLPLPAIERFPACQPDAGGQMRIENGPSGRGRVTMAVVVLNQRETVVILEAPGQPRVRQRPVQLAASNTLLVWMIGPPGTALGVSITSAGSCLEVAITSPAPGASVPEGPVLVQGTVMASGPVGVSVNGFPAMVHDARWAVAIPVDTSVQALTAMAVVVGGDSAATSAPIVVLPAPPASIELHADPIDGTVPLAVTWKVVNNTGRALIECELDPTGDGIFEPPVLSLDGTNTAYTMPGLWLPTLRVTDDQGAVHTATTALLASSPASVSAHFDALWTGFKSRLQTGDIAGALSFLSPTLRPRMERVFQDLGADLAAVASIFGDVHLTDQVGELAEALLVQDEPSGRQLYFIQFRRDSLGRWLIEEM